MENANEQPSAATGVDHTTGYEYMPPTDVECPECGCVHDERSMIPHLRWSHGYDEDAAKYRVGKTFEYEFKKWRDSIHNSRITHGE